MFVGVHPKYVGAAKFERPTFRHLVVYKLVGTYLITY